MIKVLFILIFQLLYIFNLFYFWLEKTMFDVYTLLILFQTKKNLKIIFRASRTIKTMDPQSFQFSQLLWFKNSFLKPFMDLRTWKNVLNIFYEIPLNIYTHLCLLQKWY